MFEFYVYTTSNNEDEARKFAVDEIKELVGSQYLDCRFKFENEGYEDDRYWCWLVEVHGPTGLINKITRLYEKQAFGGL